MVQAERKYTVKNLFDDDLWPMTVGFDRQWETLQNLGDFHETGYPPHNIVKTSDDEYTIELAVAGFSRDELDVEVKENFLTVKSAKLSKDETDRVYLHKGLANRSFTKRFRLENSVEVVGGEYVDGILSVYLKHIIPEEKKARKIEIGSHNEVSKPELLIEENNDERVLTKTKKATKAS